MVVALETSSTSNWVETMMSQIDLNFHLGDNPNFYAPIPWIGLSARLPVKIKPEPSATDVELVIHTSEVQTLADWQAHQVKLDGSIVGVISSKTSSDPTQHDIVLPEHLIRGGKPQTLTIEVVGRGPGLEDDFIVQSLHAKNASLTLGWR